MVFSLKVFLPIWVFFSNAHSIYSYPRTRDSPVGLVTRNRSAKEEFKLFLYSRYFRTVTRQSIRIVKTNTIINDNRKWCWLLNKVLYIAVVKNHDRSKPLFLMVSHNAPHGGNVGALLQAPPATVRSMRHVESQERRIFSGMNRDFFTDEHVLVKSIREKSFH